MQALHLVEKPFKTGDYKPFAGSGRCMVLEYSGFVMQLQVGDDVVVHHDDDAATNHGASIATEFVKVRAAAVAPVRDIVKAHGPSTGQKLANIWDSIYPVEEGEERNPEKLFIALYF